MRKLFAILAATTAISTAHAANIFTEARQWGGSYIYVIGVINPGDDEVFAALDPPRPVYVRPIGPGGNVVTALNIADMIWMRGYATYAANVDHTGAYQNVGCASACTLLWLAGRQVIAQGSA